MRAVLAGKANLNTATAFELAQLPGIGPRKAAAIVEHRNKRTFRFPEQIVKVRGIGRATFRRLKPYLSVEGPTTLRLVEAGTTDAPAGAPGAEGDAVPGLGATPLPASP